MSKAPPPRGHERFVVVGETPYAYERDAIEFAFDQLRGHGDPYQARALVELLDGGTGQLYEIDLLVLGYSALFLVEIKSHPGTIEGSDAVDWLWTTPEGRQRPLDAPLRLANHKAKVLKSHLERVLRDNAPWVQPLIFLSDPNVQNRLTGDGRTAVVTRDGLKDALVHGRFPGRGDRFPSARIGKPQMLAIAGAFDRLGLRARKGKLRVGDYELGDLLVDTPLYQDRIATHSEIPDMRRRARTYLVPAQTSIEHRQSCKRKADREVLILRNLATCAGVLPVFDYHASAPQGPTVLFDDFTGGVTLDVFLQRNPDLGFNDRLDILEQVTHTLAQCHRKSVIHGALAPDAILVRRHTRDDGKPVLETRLFNFQLGASELVSGTIHRTQLTNSPQAVYQAPELVNDPSARGRHSDLFSLGAVAYFLFTGEPPARNLHELDARLARDKYLDPWAVREDIPEPVRDAITCATSLVFANRIDDAAVWLESLLADLTAPILVGDEEPSPLEAREGAILGGDLLVHGLLGLGGSARVLRVERDNIQYALKVSLGPEHDARLRDEARWLADLHHSAIVQCREVREFGSRTCLLLTLAGSANLQHTLAAEGILPIADAIRYGEDLLDALDHLAERGVLHRDLKPANLGVGALSKKARRLTVLDFSIAASAEHPPTDFDAGTAPYRDPYLRRRGAWDLAADRWSAAIVLHELLTGIRPGFGALGQPLVDPDDPEQRLILAAERFDPSARDRLIRFFNRALAPDLTQRFPSAREMRHVWVQCFEDPIYHPVLAPARPGEPAQSLTSPSPQPVSEDILDESRGQRLARLGRELGRVHPDTPVGELPLSVRAKNALDRAGLARMADVLALPNNRLSAIRGIGRKVAQEILDLRDAWEHARAIAPAPAAPDPFFPDYAGDDLPFTDTLPSALLPFLADAGLTGLAGVAAAPRVQIEHLTDRAGLKSKDLREILRSHHDRALTAERPAGLDAWLHALLPDRGKKVPQAIQLVRQLFGLDGPFAGRLDVRVRDFARATGLTTQRVYQALAQAADHWRQHPAIADLIGLSRLVLRDIGGAAPLARVADALARALGSEPAREVPTRAAALLQVAAKLSEGTDTPDPLTIGRLRERRGDPPTNDAPWVALGHARLGAARELGRGADALAARAVLASPGEAEQALRAIAAGTPFADLDRATLAELATAASQNAARSSRAEIYPRGLDPRRALDLSAAVLTGGLTPDQLRARVQARYPEAAPLPDDDELHALLAPLGLAWDAVGGRYVRPEQAGATIPSTSMAPVERLPTAMPGQKRAKDADARTAADFDDQLRAAVESGGLRVLQVRADWTIDAARALAHVLRRRAPTTRVVHVDQALLQRMQARMQARGARPTALAETDAAGPQGRYWANITGLAQKAADELATELFPAPAPTLLLQPGLLARYQLDSFVRALVDRTTRSDGQAVFLLVPSHDMSGPPELRGSTGSLPIPGLLPGQRAWIPLAWLRNLHAAAA